MTKELVGIIGFTITFLLIFIAMVAYEVGKAHGVHSMVDTTYDEENISDFEKDDYSAEQIINNN